MNAKGTAFKYNDNVDTDVIIPARYLNSSDPAELASHCMEDIDPEFVRKVKKGDLIVAGKNFGCGSSREAAPANLLKLGVKAVIAQSFARIFFRNSIALGLPVMVCKDAVQVLHDGDFVELDIASGTLTGEKPGVTLQTESYSKEILELIRSGGIVAQLRTLKEKGAL